LKTLILIILSLLSAAPLASRADDTPQPGRVGSEVPSYQMRTVSGPMMNRSICQVCRNGDRPVVMVILREVGPDQRVLLRNIDRLIAAERDRGLRAFGAYLSPDPFRDISRVQTFVFNAQIAMPIGVTPDALSGGTILDIPDSSTAAVFLYSEKKVWRRFDFSGEHPTHDEVREILAAARKMLDENHSPAAVSAGTD
jgi:hypothetical protein